MNCTIRKALSDEDILACHPVMAELRPHVGAGELVAAVRRMEKEGYTLASLADDDGVQAVVGYRIIEMLRTGRMLEIDDLVTSNRARSKGYGKRLHDWVMQEARANGCSVVELDSAVHRADAHRFYFRERMHVLGFHFSISI